jgi:hypothetical protein
MLRRRSITAKALELPQYKPQKIPNKKRALQRKWRLKDVPG